MALSLVSVPRVPAQSSAPDMITRIVSGEFSGNQAAAPPWFEGGRSYVVIEPAKTPGRPGSDVVKYDTATGQAREVLVTAAQPHRRAQLQRSRSKA
jgi:hypothetical protein